MKNKRLVECTVLALAALHLSACSGAQVRSAAGERIIAGSYAIAVPSSGDWTVNVQRGKETVELLDDSTGILSSLMAQEHSVRIMVFANLVREEGWPMSDDETALDFLDNEVNVMQERGVKPGLYSLSDISRGTDTVGSRKVHYLKYRTGMNRDGRSYLQDAALYLYFPPDFSVSHRFYGFHFSDMHTGVWLGKVDTKPLMEVIGSFQISPPSELPTTGR